MILFCQTDVTGRTEPDPAADALVRNIMRYIAAWKPRVEREVVYAGGDEGKHWLKSMGIPFTEYSGESLSQSQLLVVAPGNVRPLPQSSPVLALGLDESQATHEEYISSWFEPYPANSPFAGISPAEVHNRAPRTLPLINGGVLAKSGNAVYSQLAPWQFLYTSDEMNIKRTFRHVNVLTMRLLANLGVSPHTNILSNFAKPVEETDQRWLQGLYADVPQEWDDPYRFFRW
jgi:hypothetical protein